MHLFVCLVFWRRFFALLSGLIGPRARYEKPRKLVALLVVSLDIADFDGAVWLALLGHIFERAGSAG